MLHNKNLHTITVFEHESIYTNKGRIILTNQQLKELQLFYREKDFPYYSLLNNGVKFSEYVGIIQIGSLTIEVLPKADNHGVIFWRSVLINMLNSVSNFEIHAPSTTDAKLSSNSILDLYIDVFLFEAERLVHLGLIKNYKRVSANQNALRGKLIFNKHININLTRQERFFVNYTVYDKDNLLNKIIYKTLALIKLLNNNPIRYSRVNSLMANFPQLSLIEVNETTFNSIHFNRKTDSYRNIIGVSRLLLLQFHPDLSSGKNNVLALMFNMNLLWEKFVLKSLKKFCKNALKIESQTSSLFWKEEDGYSKKIRPDIIITTNSGRKLVIDSKWKNINNSSPSDNDLRQMYVYSSFNNNANSILMYPGTESKYLIGNFYNVNITDRLSEVQCGILTIRPLQSLRDWQLEIANIIDSRL